jgi:hypothetical protein
MGYDHSALKSFQINLIYSIFGYIYICNRSRDMRTRAKDIIKFVYYFMILFLTLYIFKHFLFLLLFSQQGSVIMFLL